MKLAFATDARSHPLSRRCARSWLAVFGLAVALSLIAGSAYAAGAWAGFVTHVSDGDTIDVRPAQGGPVRRIRLEAMDAPEICQSWGPQARQALMQRVQNRRVQVKGHAHDVYGRLVARISVDGEDVGAWMVAQGHAWSYRWHGRKGRYDAEATAARRQARGLFASASPEPPRDFRRRRGSCHPAR